MNVGVTSNEITNFLSSKLFNIYIYTLIYSQCKMSHYNDEIVISLRHDNLFIL